MSFPVLFRGPCLLFLRCVAPSTITATPASSSAMRHMTSLRFVNEKPTFLKRIHSMMFFRPVVLGTVGVGGLAASIAAIMYYFHSTGDLARLVAGTDKIRFERGLLVLDRNVSNPHPESVLAQSTVKDRTEKVVMEAPLSEEEGGGGGGGGSGGNGLRRLSVPLPVLSFAFWAFLTATTAALAYGRSRLDLHYRQFANRVGFSLTILDENSLKLRTVAERGLDAMMMGNPAAARFVLDAAKKVQKNPPFLKLPPNESYVLMKAIFNELSPLGAAGFFHYERKLEVERGWYIIAPTYETNAVFKKFRVVIASESLLSQVAKLDPSFVPVLEDEVHIRRWETVKKMSQMYEHTGCNNPGSVLWKIELMFPKLPSPTTATPTATPTVTSTATSPVFQK